MSDLVQRQRLSTTAIAWLSALAGFNLVLVLYYTLWHEPEDVLPQPEPAAATGPELRLLNELSDEEREAMVRTTPDLEPRELPQRIVTEAVRVCRRWGPFADTTVLESVRESVASVGEILDVRSSELHSAPDYLVRLDSDNNLDIARRLRKELETQSIDAYVIAGGEFVNSVSAGVFSTEGRADRQMARLVDLGYVPRKEALERVQTVHHVIALVPEDFRLESHDSSSCPAIAQAR